MGQQHCDSELADFFTPTSDWGNALDAASGDLPTPPDAMRRLSGVKLICPIADTQMSHVWRGVDLVTGKDLAIKTPRGGEHANFNRQAVATEAALLGRLTHAGVLSSVYTDPSPDHPTVATAYLDAVDLLKGAEQLCVSVSHRLKLFLRLCDTIAYLHSQHVVHRDIKPDNVLVTLDGQPVLIDFATAGRMDAGAAPILLPTHAAGSSHYMAPEARDTATHKPDPTQDIYALGHVLRELLEPVTSPIPRPLTRIIDRCTQPNPHKRFQNITELITAIESREERARALKTYRRTAITGLVFFAIVSGVLVAQWPEAAKQPSHLPLGVEARLSPAQQALNDLRHHDTSKAQSLLSSTPYHQRAWEWYFLRALTDTVLSTPHANLPLKPTLQRSFAPDVLIANMHLVPRSGELLVTRISARAAAPPAVTLHTATASSLALSPPLMELCNSMPVMPLHDNRHAVRVTQQGELHVLDYRKNKTTHLIKIGDAESDVHTTHTINAIGRSATLRVYLSNIETDPDTIFVVNVASGATTRLAGAGGYVQVPLHHPLVTTLPNPKDKNQSTAKLWSEEPTPRIHRAFAIDHPVHLAALSHDGKSLVACSRHFEMTLLDVQTGKRVARNTLPLQGHACVLLRFDLTDKRIFASYGHGMCVLDASTLNLILQIPSGQTFTKVQQFHQTSPNGPLYGIATNTLCEWKTSHIASMASRSSNSW